MRGALTVIGVALIVAGLLFAAQGRGWLPYPAESFMVGASPWVWRGLGIAAVGLVLLVVGRRR